MLYETLWDDNTIRSEYKCSPSMSLVLNCLEHDITNVLNCFKVNSLKTNLVKLQFMVLSKKKSFYLYFFQI